MQEQFIPYKQALKLKELGFDEECFTHYCEHWKDAQPYLWELNQPDYPKYWDLSTKIGAPLWQQAFDWLCKKIDFYENNLSMDYGSNGWTLCIHQYDSLMVDLFSNEKALDKLIEIVEKNEN